MSDYHVLSQSKDGNRLNVILHIPVPVMDNDAGVSYQDAIVDMQGGVPIASQLTDISFEEQGELDTGMLYEVGGGLQTFPAEDIADKIVRLDALWTATRTRVYAELAFRLQYWGFSRDIS